MKAVLLMLAAVSISHSQDLKETYGKTNSEILKMGYDRWYKFYTGKAGDNTIGMSSATVLYANALGDRTDRQAVRLGPAYGGRSRRLRSLFRNYQRSAVEVGGSLTGGGTIWSLNGASYLLSGEETLAKLLRADPKAPSRVVSDVTKEFSGIAKALNSPEIRPGFRKGGVESLAEMRKTFASIVRESKSLTRKQSDAVLEYCRSIAADLRHN